MSNHLPHSRQGMPSSFKVLWRDLELAGILQDNDLVRRTKAARARNLTQR